MWAPHDHVTRGPHAPGPVGSNRPPPHRALSPGTALPPSLPGSQGQEYVPLAGEESWPEVNTGIESGVGIIFSLVDQERENI